ncbi:MAG: hypothetical protein AB8B53_08825 [Flavobacteriales bacterium]
MNKFLILFLSVFLSLGALAQDYNPEPEKDDSGPSFKDRLVLDGNVVLQFGNITVLGANPQIGYRITETLTAGIGYNYQYFSFNYGNGTRAVDALYGPTAFANARIFDNYFLRADFQTLKYVQSSNLDANAFEFNLDRLLLGGGMIQPISDRVSAYFGAFIDVLSPNPTPIVRAGIQAGFGRW